MKRAENYITLQLYKYFISKLNDYLVLFKFQLSLLVVITSILGYLIADTNFSFINLVILFTAGFLLTGGSNAYNQIIEKDYDKLMQRTCKRPVASNRMSSFEASLIAGIFSLTGIFVLWLYFNVYCGILASLAFFLYVFVYTPLKRITSFSIFVGAFPGAIPPMIGWVAAKGHFGLEPGLLFAIQFLWQFPHFWALAWLANDDYKKAGFKLLPFAKEPGKISAIFIFVHSIILFFLSILPYLFGFITFPFLLIIIFLGILLNIPAFKLIKKLEKKYVKNIMFLCYLYLPITLIVYCLNKII